MDLLSIIDQLRQEAAELDKAIGALEKLHAHRLAKLEGDEAELTAVGLDAETEVAARADAKA